VSSCPRARPPSPHISRPVQRRTRSNRGGSAARVHWA
jgi:hypothetical protein